MLSFLSTGPLGKFRGGAYGLAIALPFLPSVPNSLVFEQELLVPKQAFQESQLQRNELLLTEGSEVNEQDLESLSSSPLKDASEDNRVLISEVIVEGISDHPDKERLELVVYDAMSVRPGSRVTREEVKRDLDAIYSTGWFSGLRIESIDGPLGVRLIVQVKPNPTLSRVLIDPNNANLPLAIVDEIFRSDLGKTLNLNSLQLRMKKLKEWYTKEGYSLARLAGPSRITEEGIVTLKVIEGTVEGIEIQFLNKEGATKDEKGKKIKPKTKSWVIKREISIKKGEIFNRKRLEADIKRLYNTSLFSDVRVSLKPITGKPGNVIIILGVIEQSTGSLSGGIGYSQSQGMFGQVGLQDSNLFGRAWNAALNMTYGQYGGLADLSFSDPWIKGDLHRTSFKTSLFLSRELPQAFRSSNGNIRTLSNYYDANSNYAYRIDSTNNPAGRKFDSVAIAKSTSPENSWFDFEGNSVALQRVGGKIVFARPLNKANPYEVVPWNLLLGLNIQKIRPINFSGEERPYGVATNDFKEGKSPGEDVICIGFDCANENNLFGVRVAATYNNLNDSRNPTSGNFLSLGTEQFISVGEHSPTFNRFRAGYTHFIPVNWLKIAKGCRPKAGEKSNCPQAIGFQVKSGTIIGQLPPYSAFCMGGSKSIRGWSDCDLSVGRSFGEASVEYRFPIWNIVAGEFFVDAGTDFGSQDNVPGKPGKILEKPGSGFSLGTGLIVTTPVGPLRLEAASQGFSGDWRFNLGVGWKF